MSVIRIPSKNIYQMENPKVIDNVISKVEVECKSPIINIENGNIYNEQVIIDTNIPYEIAEEDLSSKSYVSATGNTSSISSSVAYVKITPKYFNTIIQIPKMYKNYYIQKVFENRDENDQPNINYSMIGLIDTGDIYASATVIGVDYNNPNNTLILDDFDLSKPTNIKTEETTYTLTDKTEQKETAPNAGIFITSTTAVVDLTDLTNLDDVTAQISTDYYIYNLKVLCGLKVIKCQNTFERVEYPSDKGPNFPILLNGTYTEYIPEKVTFNFKGTKIELILNNNQITIGSGNDVMSFSGNELMQTTNTPSLETQYQAVINDWQNGKETATLRCSIDDYRDNDTNELVISANGNDTLPMMFHIGDVVIPYVFGTNGQDKPMSTNIDGSAKKFIIVGKKPISDGAVWQEITLQEKTD